MLEAGKPGAKFRKIAAAVLFFIWLIIAFGCSSFFGQPRPAEDTTYLTPIPSETWESYPFGLMIENKLQAVIAARKVLSHGEHLIPVGAQNVVSVERLPYGEVRKRLNQLRKDALSGSGPGDPTEVWLVEFIGDMQLDPPRLAQSSATPYPPGRWCSYVILSPFHPDSGESFAVGCSSKEKP